MRRRFGIVIVALLIALLAASDYSLAQESREDVVAVGDGFAVTQEDVKQLMDYMEAKGFHSSDEQFNKASLRFRLFAEEAKALGLDEEVAEELKDKERFPRMMILQSLYLKHLIEDYPLDDIVIESYYHAHPDLFRVQEKVDGDDKEAEGSSEPGLRLLDDEVEGQIRMAIMKAKAPMLMDQKYEALKEKYNARFVGNDSAAEGEKGK